MLTKDNYYQKKMLSVSSVRQFAQNPARALAAFNGEFPWFDNDTALLLGSAMHDMLEKAMNYVLNQENINKALENRKNKNWLIGLINLAKESAINAVLDEMNNDEKYNNIRKKRGGLIADAARIPDLFSIIWDSNVMKNVAIKAVVSSKTDEIVVFTEEPFIGHYRKDDLDIPFKGRPDLFVVNYKNKIIDAYDYKTSKPFDPSGFEWGTDINGERKYLPVEWSVEKLFPWQAGTYRELLWQNGFDGFKVNYQYLVVTKEKTPRLSVFDISQESMDLGYQQFTKNLVKANDYILDKKNPPLIQDGSAFANQKSYDKPTVYKSVPWINE